MTTPGGFLSRWSRRKLEADGRGAEKAEPPEAPLAETDVPAAGEGRAIVEPACDEGLLSAEEIAALPRLEDLTAGTDLAQFMRAGVPPLLRNAALRRMWSLDPAIRDFVGEARDYSYDWNVPGGVPASGPLMPTDDVEATLSRMFSRARIEGEDDGSAAASELETSDRPKDLNPDGELAAADHQPPDAAASEAAEGPTGIAQGPALAGVPDASAPAPNRSDTPSRLRPRHGAIPKFDSV